MTGLVLDAKGNLYGTTHSGGRGIDGGMAWCSNWTRLVAKGCCTAFPRTGAKGIHPNGVVLNAQGNLYGNYGLSMAHSAGERCFKRAPTGKLTVLYNFTGGNADGGDPYAGVVRDGQGNLYGTASAGALDMERCSR